MARFDRFGKAIVMLRRQLGWSQKELAQRAGISPAMLSNYENGVKKPTLDNLGKLLDALGLYIGRLDDALDRVNDRVPRAEPAPAPGTGAPEGVDLRRFLGADRPVPPELEPAFAEMVRGFQTITRRLYRDLTHARPRPAAPPPAARAAGAGGRAVAPADSGGHGGSSPPGRTPGGGSRRSGS